MMSREYLIGEAMKSFDEIYESKKIANPHLKLPGKIKKPIVGDIEVAFWEKESYALKKEEKESEKFELNITLKGGRSKEYKLKGFCVSDEADAFCEFPENDQPEKLRIFAKYFCENLFFNVLSVWNIQPNEWNQLK